MIWPYSPISAQCRPDAWGRVSFLVFPLTLSGIDDSHHPLDPRVDVEVPDLHGLLMASPMPVERLDHFELKPE